MIGSIISSATSAINNNLGITADWYNTKETNESNQKIAEDANAWSERMSNTAYQRSMDDMKKAGLNPILAYQQGGANTPQVQTATMQKPNTGEMIQQGTNSAIDAYKKGAEAKAIAAATEKTIADKKVSELNSKILKETWIKAQMYNNLVLPVELASAKMGYNLTRTQHENDLATASLINNYKPTILKNVQGNVDGWIGSFRKNLSKHRMFQDYKAIKPYTLNKGASGQW